MEARRQKTQYNAQGMKIIMLVALFIMGICLVSASIQKNTLISDSKQISLERIGLETELAQNDATEYPKIELVDCGFLDMNCWIGSGSKKEDLNLIYNTPICSDNCEAIKEIKTYDSTSLIDDVRFYDDNNELTNIKSYEFYIQDGTQEITVEDTQPICNLNGKYDLNGDAINICHDKVIGSHIEEIPRWSKYNMGEILPAGDYVVKLQGVKKASDTVDWQIQSQGTWITDWAKWTAINSLGNFTYEAADLGANTGIGFADVVDTNWILINSAACIDGGKCVNVSNSGYSTNTYATMQTVGAWCTWFRPDLATTSATSGLIWLNDAGGANKGDFSMGIQGMNGYCSGGAITQEFNFPPSSTSVISTPQTNFASNVWVQYCAKLNSTGQYMYINGTKVNQTFTGAGNMAFFNATKATNFFMFGQSGPANTLKWTLDETHFFNVELSDAQILNMYQTEGGFTSSGSILNSPADNFLTSNTNITFNCTGTGGVALTNVSLWTNTTGTFQFNQSQTASGTTDTKIFSLIAPNNASFIWNCQACTSLGCNFASANRSVTTHTAGPVIKLISGNGTSLLQDIGTNKSFSYNITDDFLNTSACFLKYNALDHFGTLTNEGWNLNNSFVTNNATQHYIVLANNGFMTKRIGRANNVNITLNSIAVSGSAPRGVEISVDGVVVTPLIETDGTYFLNLTNVTTTQSVLKINCIQGGTVFGLCGAKVDKVFTDNSYFINIPCTSSAINSSSFNISTGGNTAQIFANDTAQNQGTYNFNWTNIVVQNSQTYSPNTLAGALESFGLNITFDPSYTGVSVNLIYNNTVFTTSPSNIGNTILFTTSLTVPSVPALTNKSFYWNITLSNSSTTTNLQTSTTNQTVNLLTIDNCTSNSAILFNITMFDQDTLLPLNGTVQLTANIFAFGTSTIVSTYNNSFNYVIGRDTLVCVSNLSGSYSLGYIFKFAANSSYFTQYKTIQLLTVTNSTLNQNIQLYDLLQTTGGFPFVVSITGSDILNNANILVDAQRQYINLNQFKSVESSVTDNSGDTVLHLVQGSIIYNFVVSYNGVVLGTFNNNQVQCTNSLTGDCNIILNLATANAGVPDFNNFGNVSVVYLLDNNRNLFTTFLTTDGSSKTITSVIIKNDGYGNTTICSSTIVGTSGTLGCSIPILYGNTTFISKLYANGQYIGSNFFSLGETGSTIFFGVRTILMLLLYSTLVMLMLANPILIVIGAILGIFFGVTLLLIEGGSAVSIGSAVIWFIIAGGIIIWQISKRI